MLRVITKAVKYDSTKGKDIVIVDTSWGRGIYLPKIDSLQRVVVDKNGDTIFNTQPNYILVPKDSVRWKGIEGTPIDSLLSKKAPVH